MKTEKKILLFVFVTLFVFGQSASAFDDGDFQYWFNVGASADISKNWKVTAQEEFRLGDDAKRLYYHHWDVGFVYGGFADWLDMGFGYRHIYQRDSGGFGDWRQEQSPYLTLTLKGKIFDMPVSNTSRFEYRDLEKDKDHVRYRNKTTLKFPLKLTPLNLQPYIADEIFISSNGLGLSGNRFFAGFTLELLKGINGDIYYMLQSMESRSGWNDTNVIGTALKIAF
ncbi:MAG: DUF2490 domain-containing protein [Phycisphaerae bacterium]